MWNIFAYYLASASHRRTIQRAREREKRRSWMLKPFYVPAIACIRLRWFYCCYCCHYILCECVCVYLCLWAINPHTGHTSAQMFVRGFAVIRPPIATIITSCVECLGLAVVCNQKQITNNAEAERDSSKTITTLTVITNINDKNNNMPPKVSGELLRRLRYEFYMYTFRWGGKKTQPQIPEKGVRLMSARAWDSKTSM